MGGKRRRQTHLNDDLEAIHLYSGAWSQWDREVVVVEAEKGKEEIEAYVKCMDVAILMFVGRSFNSPQLILPVVPSLQRRLRKFWNATVWHVIFRVFKDCSDRHIHHSFWIELTLAFMGSSTY